MKKTLISFLFLLSSYFGFCQFPNNIPQNNASTEVYWQGAIGTTYGLHYRNSFADTTAANNHGGGFLKNIAGFVIRTVNDLWIRSNDLTHWIKQASGTVTNDWSLTGNTLVSDTNFLGTINNKSLNVRTNNLRSGFIDITNSNTTWGYRAGESLDNGTENAMFGEYAGRLLTDGDFNTAIGSKSLDSTTNGAANIGLGFHAGHYNKTGSDQVFINSIDRVNFAGDTSESPIYVKQAINTNNQRIRLNGNIFGNKNVQFSGLPTSVGTKAVRIDGSGNLSVADTFNVNGTAWSLSGNSGTNLSSNFLGTTDAVGLIFRTNNVRSGYIDIINNNTSFGQLSLADNTPGINNVAIGYQAIRIGNNGSFNTGVGVSALSRVSGDSNTGVGFQSLASSDNGVSNTAIGINSLFATEGVNNIGIGAYAGQSNTNGSNQIFINSILRSNYTGDTLESPIYVQQDPVVASQNIKLNGNIFGSNNVQFSGLPSGAGTQAIRVDANGNLFRADTTISGSTPLASNLLHVDSDTIKLGGTATEDSTLLEGDDKQLIQNNFSRWIVNGTPFPYTSPFNAKVGLFAQQGVDSITSLNLFAKHTGNGSAFTLTSDAANNFGNYIYGVSRSTNFNAGWAGTYIEGISNDSAMGLNAQGYSDGNIGYNLQGQSSNPVTADIAIRPNNQKLQFNNLPVDNLSPVLLSIGNSGWVSTQDPNSLPASPFAWNINGNSNITSTQFLGTTNDSSLIFKVNNTESGKLTINGNTSLGLNSISSGIFSTAMGSDAAANFDYSLAIGGNSALADNNYAIAIGTSSVSSGLSSISLGTSSVGSGDSSIAIGAASAATAVNAYAFGKSTLSNAANSTALGYNAKAVVSNSVVLGDTLNTLVGIRTGSPLYPLSVIGTTQIKDGTEGAGKVFTSDANGVGSWQLNSSSNYISLPFLYAYSYAASGQLQPGATYKITGCHPGLYNDGVTDTTTIFLKALDSFHFAQSGQGLFYNVAYDQGITGNGVWTRRSTWDTANVVGTFEGNEFVTADNGATGIIYTTIDALSFIPAYPSTGDWTTAVSITGSSSGATMDISSVVLKTYSISDFTWYGGYVWQNTTGDAGEAIDVYTLDATNWVKIPYSSGMYNLVLDDISFDINQNFISRRYDRLNNNEVVFSKIDQDYFNTALGIPGNAISSFQWGNTFNTFAQRGVGNFKVWNSIYENINSEADVEHDNIITGNSYLINSTFYGSRNIRNKIENFSTFYNISQWGTASGINNITANHSDYHEIYTTEAMINDLITYNAAVRQITQYTNGSMLYGYLQGSTVHDYTLKNGTLSNFTGSNGVDFGGAIIKNADATNLILTNGASISNINTDGFNINAINLNNYAYNLGFTPFLENLDSLTFDGNKLVVNVIANPIQYETPTTGNTIVADGRTLVINPATILASLTITFPPNPLDGQIFKISFANNQIVSLTLNGGTIWGGVTSAGGDSGREWVYSTAGGAWVLSY